MTTSPLLNDRIHLSAMKAIARRFVEEIFEAGHADAIDELVSDDFVSHSFGITENGPEQLRAATERVHASLTGVEFAIDDLVAEDDRVVVRLTASATATGEFMGVPDARGRSYRIGEIHIFRIGEGQVVEHWHQHDALGLMRQIGGLPSA